MAEVDEGGNPLPEDSSVGGAPESSSDHSSSASPASRASAPRRVSSYRPPRPLSVSSAAPAATASPASVRSVDNALEKAETQRREARLAESRPNESRLTETAPVRKFEEKLTSRIDQLNGDKPLSEGDRRFVKEISAAHFLAKAQEAGGGKPYSESFAETSRDALKNAKSGRTGLSFNVDDLNVTNLDGPQQRAGGPSQKEIKVGGVPLESRLTETAPIKLYEKTLTERVDRANGDKPVSEEDRKAIKLMTQAFSIAAGQSATQSGPAMTLSDNFNDASKNVVKTLKEDLRLGQNSGMTVSPEDLRTEANIAVAQVKQAHPRM